MCKKAELQFSIFLMYQLAENWQKTPCEVYKILNQTKILDDYIIKHYDVLHTQSSLSLIEDISDFAREKGIAI